MHLTPGDIEALAAQQETIPTNDDGKAISNKKNGADRPPRRSKDVDPVTSGVHKIEKKIKANAHINQEQLQSFVRTKLPRSKGSANDSSSNEGSTQVKKTLPTTKKDGTATKQGIRHQNSLQEILGVRLVRQHASAARRPKRHSSSGSRSSKSSRDSSKSSSTASSKSSLPEETEQILLDLSLIEEDQMVDIRLKTAACEIPVPSETIEDREGNEEPRALVFDDVREEQAKLRELLPAPLYKKKQVSFMADIYIQEIRRRAKDEPFDEKDEETASSELNQDVKNSIHKIKKLLVHDSLHDDEGDVEESKKSIISADKRERRRMDEETPKKTEKRLSPKNRKVQESIKRIRARLDIHSPIDLDEYTQTSDCSSVENDKVADSRKNPDRPVSSPPSCWNFDDVWFGVDSDTSTSLETRSGQYYSA